MEVLDYILKPITLERFLKSIEKFLRSKEHLPMQHIDKKDDKVIIVKSNNVFYKININSIFYIESQKDYCKLFLEEKEIICRYKISEFEKELAEYGFLQIHRSFLINTKHLHSYTVSNVTVGTHTVPIGQNFKELSLRYFDSKNN